MGTLSVEKQEKLEADAAKAERKAEKKAEAEAKKKEVGRDFQFLYQNLSSLIIYLHSLQRYDISRRFDRV